MITFIFPIVINIIVIINSVKSNIVITPVIIRPSSLALINSPLHVLKLLPVREQGNHDLQIVVLLTLIVVD